MEVASAIGDNKEEEMENVICSEMVGIYSWVFPAYSPPKKYSSNAYATFKALLLL